MEHRFNRVISLGWFCGPAMNIKEMGYRDASYPFDWLLTHEYSGIIELLFIDLKMRSYYSILGNPGDGTVIDM